MKEEQTDPKSELLLLKEFRRLESRLESLESSLKGLKSQRVEAPPPKRSKQDPIIQSKYSLEIDMCSASKLFCFVFVQFKDVGIHGRRKM